MLSLRGVVGNFLLGCFFGLGGLGSWLIMMVMMVKNKLVISMLVSIWLGGGSGWRRRKDILGVLYTQKSLR